MHHLYAAICQMVEGGGRDQGVGDQSADLLDGAADTAAGDAELGVVCHSNDMGCFIDDQLLEFSDLAGVFGGAAFRHKAVAGENGKVDAVEGGKEILGKEADTGQRLPLDQTADVIYGKAVAQAQLRGDAQRVGQNRQIFLLAQQGQYLKYGGASIQKNGAAVGDQRGDPFGNALFEQLILLQAGIPCLNGGGNAGILRQTGTAVDFLDKAFLFEDIQIAANRFDGNAENVTKILV